MTLPAGAYVSEEGWIVYGDEAFLPHEWAAQLTPREREVIELLAEGKASNLREAARHIGVAAQTLQNTMVRARRRTGSRSTMEMVAKFSRGDL